jgi:hypothetical protein
MRRFGFVASAVLLAASTSAIAATASPYDFTGTWLGEAHSGKRHATVDATLTSTGPTTFDGEFVLEGATRCLVRNGKLTKRVHWHVTCGLGNGAVSGRLNQSTNTIRGSFSLRGHVIVFSMTKSG